MNNLKKYLGLVWLLLAPATLIIFILQIKKVLDIANAKIAAETNPIQLEILKTDKANSLLQWGILLLVFSIIIIGFFIFGRYALSGAYSQKEEE
jgi:ABC-type polysaccharide/polyol phosphate export permease